MKVLPKPGGVQRGGGLGLGVRWWWTVNIPTRALGVQATLLANLGKGTGHGFATIAWDLVSEPTPLATPPLQNPSEEASLPWFQDRW